jgi:hypothetical protein
MLVLLWCNHSSIIDQSLKVEAEKKCMGVTFTSVKQETF